MLARLRDSFQEDLLAVSWMDDATKNEATYKLGSMFFSVGFPPGVCVRACVRVFACVCTRMCVCVVCV